MDSAVTGARMLWDTQYYRASFFFSLRHSILCLPTEVGWVGEGACFLGRNGLGDPGLPSKTPCDLWPLASDNSPPFLLHTYL